MFADDACLNSDHDDPTKLENIINSELVTVSNWLGKVKVRVQDKAPPGHHQDRPPAVVKQHDVPGFNSALNVRPNFTFLNSGIRIMFNHSFFFG